VHDPRLLRYLLELAQDPLLAREFRTNPDLAMSRVDLSPAQRDVLRSGDPAQIRAALAERPVEDDLLLLSWLGSIADDRDVQS
jgi:hypothetical protein